MNLPAHVCVLFVEEESWGVLVEPRDKLALVPRGILLLGGWCVWF